MDEWRPSKRQHYWERSEYWEESERLEETCCHPISSERLSDVADVKNSIIIIIIEMKEKIKKSSSEKQESFSKPSTVEEISSKELTSARPSLVRKSKLFLKWTSQEHRKRNWWLYQKPYTLLITLTVYMCQGKKEEANSGLRNALIQDLSLNSVFELKRAKILIMEAGNSNGNIRPKKQ